MCSLPLSGIPLHLVLVFRFLTQNLQWFIFKHIDKEEYVLSTSSPVKDEVAVEDPEVTVQRKI